MSRSLRFALRLFVAGLGATASAAAAGAGAAPASLDAVWQAKVNEPGLLPVDGRPLPFSAEGRARYEKNVAGLRDGSLVDDARYLCLSQGLPRALISGYPFQIIETAAEITIVYEENRTYRIIKRTDRHADPAVWDPSYMGDGIARQESGELVIDSTNFKSEKLYLDSTGLPASPQLHVIEHLSLSRTGQELVDLITIDDPAIFTRPWTARRVYARRSGIELQTDWVCGEPHRDLSARVVTKKPTSLHTPAPPTAAQLAMGGYWINAVAPVSGLAIAQVAAGVQRTAPGVTEMLAKQQPWAAAERTRAMAALAAGQYVPTPEMQCYAAQLPGTSRFAPGGYGLEIVISPQYVVFLAEANAIVRMVRMNQNHPAQLAASWQGDSIGHWEGDTLVVDTVGFNNRNYLDRGVPFTSKMHIVERLKVNDGQLVNTATLDDPGAFTSPFDISIAYRRSIPFQEYVCQENNREGGVPTSSGQPTRFNLPQLH